MGAGAAGGPRPVRRHLPRGGAATGGGPYELGSVRGVLMARGAVEGIGQGEGRLWFVDGTGEPFAERDLHDVRHEYAIEQALAMLSRRDLPSIEAIGHRVVHGGPNHFAPEILTQALIEDLRQQRRTAWAPLHMPASLRVIEALEVQRPGLPQVACFDTAFHASMPEIARRLPLPRRFFDQEVYQVRLSRALVRVHSGGARWPRRGPGGDRPSGAATGPAWQRALTAGRWKPPWG